MKKLHNAQRGFIGSIIGLVFGLILALLTLRFVLRFFGANPANDFASFVYQTSAPLVEPFFGLFSYQAELSTARFEIATLIAIVVYGIIAALINSILNMGSRRSTTY